MKSLKHAAILACLALGFFACGPSGPSQADLQAEEEANQLDSVTQVLDQVIEDIDEDASSLEAALDSLDVLFPEEEQ